MNRDQLEFAISQYVDNTLSAADRSALERHIESDPEARQILTEYRTLNEMLRGHLPAPQVEWDRLAEKFSGAVAQEEMPARVLRMPWVGIGSGLAIAASVLLAVGVGFFVYRQRNTTTTQPQAVAIVQIEGAQLAAAPAVVQIEVGPATEVADAQYLLSEGIVYRPSSVRLIASSEDAGQDTHRAPFQQ